MCAKTSDVTRHLSVAAVQLPGLTVVLEFETSTAISGNWREVSSSVALLRCVAVPLIMTAGELAIVRRTVRARLKAH